ncbi:hypothetical protein LENED_004702 [Lentinula edodes]|uniref:Uncharacterized protein n=1 Tax=Lentinula edodes TaxID=5353 RepID=A0A1Q3E7E6_LENED|nr:hypothetical protein LENED_004702 [Lentinula edodes]
MLYYSDSPKDLTARFTTIPEDIWMENFDLIPLFSDHFPGTRFAKFDLFVTIKWREALEKTPHTMKKLGMPGLHHW